MKHLLKLVTTFALGVFVVVSCQEKNNTASVEKPVVTAEMYSVTVNSDNGEVVFKFTEPGLNPSWTVKAPDGTKESFYDREITKKYEVAGIYSGTLVAFGEGGESDPVEFSFNPLGEVDATLSQTENILISQPWKPYDLIYYGGEGETYWEWNTEIPASAADDRLTFHKDGKFELNLGANTKIFNDMGEGGIHHEKIVPTGEEKWSYEKEGEAEFIVFSNGGFPGMLADNDGINGKYEIRNVTANRFELHYYQAAQGQSLCFVYVSENYVEESGDPELSKENVEKTLSGKTFEVSAFGWCDYGDNAWEYFKDPVPETTAEDRITFNADGTLVIDLGEDLTIYHDNGWRTIEKGWFEDEKWIIAGGETWAVKSDPTGVFVKFDNGGFPLMLASSNIEGPEYNLGLDGQWTVASIKEDGTIRLEIYQNFNKQWFNVFLSPVE